MIGEAIGQTGIAPSHHVLVVVHRLASRVGAGRFVWSRGEGKCVQEKKRTRALWYCDKGSGWGLRAQLGGRGVSEARRGMEGEVVGGRTGCWGY